MKFFTKNLNVPGTCKEYNLVLHFIHELQGKRPCLNQTIASRSEKKEEEKRRRQKQKQIPPECIFAK